MAHYLIEFRFQYKRIRNYLKEIIKKIFKKERVSHKPIFKKTYSPLKFIFKNGYGLSSWAEKKAVRKNNKLLTQFVQKNKRNPTKSEVGRIIINASHTTIKYRRGRSGHWGRQKVRHYLFNLHGMGYTKK